MERKDAIIDEKRICDCLQLQPHQQERIFTRDRGVLRYLLARRQLEPRAKASHRRAAQRDRSAV
jgi:hypothetical protein